MMDLRKVGEGSWRHLSLMTALLLFFLAGTSGLRIVDIEVPSSVLPSDTIHLKCIFNLEKDQLYSVTWWRDQRQFYQYSPTIGKSKYEDKGITVDETRSSMDTVVLRNVSLASSGTYKCEVVAEHTYEKDSRSQAMEVVEILEKVLENPSHTHEHLIPVSDLSLSNAASTSPTANLPFIQRLHFTRRQCQHQHQAVVIHSYPRPS
ncbi:uncharacterized protein LOC122252038 [Penaeus japonicus]|uniref:uncharacterized protein LOC122252038 n=1 Tax=Penaeus japonicus TaxID=27405 RepID=UPI001C70D4D0|nr:uncharacterized protein LOC122252038 [Penaeus japonicus]